MRTRNVRASLSPLHAGMEALLWAMKCMRNLRQFQVTFATSWSQLVKMVSEFCKLFGRFKNPERNFPLIRDHLCTMNAKY